MSWVKGLKPSKECTVLLCEFEAAVGGWGVLSFVVSESLDTSPHLAGGLLSVRSLSGLLGLFDALTQIGFGKMLCRELFLSLKAELRVLITVWTSLVIQGFRLGKTQMVFVSVTFSTQHLM